MADSTADAVPLRALCAPEPDEVLVFATDLASEPPSPGYWFDINPLAHLKCSRALLIAAESDIVVLSGPLNHPYYEWLRQHGFGPATVVAYGQERTEISLADMVRSDPEPVRRQVRRTARRPVYIPFFANTSDHRAADALGAEIYGCDPAITLSFYDKVRFKALVRSLGAPTVEGGVRSRMPDASTGASAEAFVRMLSTLLTEHSALIIRGALGASGSSVYRVDRSNLRDVLLQLQHHAGDDCLIEPFLDVRASPNDQWGIDRRGAVHHIGLSRQLISGVKHVGNLFGQAFAPRISDAIGRTSRLIVERMSAAGYRGVAGIDYIVCETGVFPIENNARLNGSSFAFGVFERVSAGLPEARCWKYFKAAVAPCAFEDLARRCASLLYDSQRVNSFFPFDCDALPLNGSFNALLIAEDLDHLDGIERALLDSGVHRV